MKIVVLTGAGISAESGLATVRDKGGIWSQVNLEDVATPEAFERDPERVQAFSTYRRDNLENVEPNDAHRALARLEAELGAIVVTQNVDDLHERGGVARVIHMHGELRRAKCAACDASWLAPLVMDVRDPCPECAAPRTRPDIVWFGEIPYRMEEIVELLGSADIFAAIGTSAQVYPAAGFVSEARAAGAHCVEINLAATDMSGAFHERIEGRATETVPAWVDRLIADSQ